MATWQLKLGFAAVEKGNEFEMQGLSKGVSCYHSMRVC